MKAKMMAGAALAGLLALSAAANAADTQRNSANQQGAIATHPAVIDMIKPEQMRASKLLGASVYDRHNESIGKVEDLVLDKDGRVAAVVVSVGSFLGIGGKNVAVEMRNIKTDNNRLTLDRTKDQLEQAANYQLTDRETGAGRTLSPVTGGRAGGASGTSAPPEKSR
jgi:sporulation protein YlmC with PRC-barrel domain